MMKKILCMMLACVMICLTIGFAMADRVEPSRIRELVDVETSDLYMQAQFDPKTAFDNSGRMTVTLLDDELYATIEVKALKPGDTIEIYGEDHIVTKTETNSDGYFVVFTEDSDSGFEFFDYNEDIMYTSDCDIPSKAVVGVYTFPLAEQVKITAWYLTENGEQSQDLKTDVLNAADVQAFLLARSDESRDDYLNCMGNHTTITVTNGRVTEIIIEWGSDD